MENKLSIEQIKQVKARGFLLNKGTNCFNGRIITENGVINAKQLEVISKAAEIYGDGNISFTVRLNLEVPGIPYDKIDEFCEYIKQADLYTGGTGAKVRPVVCCKGTTCVFGLLDTQGLCKKIHDRFFIGMGEVELPHKFKIAVGGCPNNCAKPDLNDIGLVGQRVINYDIDKCKGCKKCGVENACPMKAATVVDKKVVIDKNICNNCGRCVGKCYFNINTQYKDMVKIYIGGRWGKKIRLGTALNKLFTTDEALDMIEKIILFYKNEGIKGERLAQTITRLGEDKVEEFLLK